MEEAENINFDQALKDIRTKGSFRTKHHGPDGNVNFLLHRPRWAEEMPTWNQEEAKRLAQDGAESMIALDKRRIYTTGHLRTQAEQPMKWCGCATDNKDCKCDLTAMGAIPTEGLIAPNHPDRENHHQETT